MVVIFRFIFRDPPQTTHKVCATVVFSSDSIFLLCVSDHFMIGSTYYALHCSYSSRQQCVPGCMKMQMSAQEHEK